MLHKNKQQLHAKKCQHSVFGHANIVSKAETTLKMKSREDAWWYQVPQSGKDLSAGTNCEFVPGGLIKVWPALKSPSSCPRLYFKKKLISAPILLLTGEKSPDNLRQWYLRRESPNNIQTIQRLAEIENRLYNIESEGAIKSIKRSRIFQISLNVCRMF